MNIRRWRARNATTYGLALQSRTCLSNIDDRILVLFAVPIVPAAAALSGSVADVVDCAGGHRV